MEKRKKIKIGTIILLILLFAFAIIQIYPLIWLLFFSLKSNTENFYTNVIGIPRVWRWGNYKDALVEGGLITYFINSVFYTAITVVVSGILSSMAAYAISRLKWKLSKFTYTLFILGIMIPIQASLLPLFLVMDKIHLLNSIWALLIPYIAFAIPMSILILTSFYKSIPSDLEEAAFIDGCNIYKTFFKIIFPLVKPALATVSIFTFLGTWNELMFANTFVNEAKYRTLTVGIMSLNGEHATDWGLIGAGMVIATLPTLVIYIILNRQVQESLVTGAVKG